MQQLSHIRSHGWSRVAKVLAKIIIRRFAGAKIGWCRCCWRWCCYSRDVVPWMFMFNDIYISYNILYL